MSEKMNRSIFGLAYVIILWLCTTYSFLTFQVLFIVIGIIALYEINRLRKNKQDNVSNNKKY